jgi:hypothetical protein
MPPGYHVKLKKSLAERPGLQIDFIGQEVSVTVDTGPAAPTTEPRRDETGCLATYC